MIAAKLQKWSSKGTVHFKNLVEGVTPSPGIWSKSQINHRHFPLLIAWLGVKLGYDRLSRSFKNSLGG